MRLCFQPLRRLLLVCTLSCVGVLPVLLTASSALADVDAAAQEHAQLLRFPAVELDQVREGSVFRFMLPGHSQAAAVQITHDSNYLNGDRVITGFDFEQKISLVLTLNKQAAFADIHIDGERWLFEGLREGEHIQGRLYQPADVQLDRLQSDFVIRRGDDKQGLPRPLTIDTTETFSTSSGAPTSSSTMGPYVRAQGSGLQISQTFSRDALFIGEQAELEVVVTLTNNSNKTLNGVDADIYFILEDSQLISAPSCSQQLTSSVPRQPVLSCRLNGSLAPGASRNLVYMVRVDAKSAPMRLWSTVYVDQVRHDAWLNVVNDVAGASQPGMLSAFNRTISDRVPEDRLGNVIIDVMALHTPDAAELYGPHTATRINQLISMANQIYQDSGVGITLRPVHHARVEYPGREVSLYTQLEQLTDASHPAFSQVGALRRRYGADLVVLFRPMNSDAGLCGLANLGGDSTRGDMTAFNDRDYAYSLVAIDCPVSSVLAHELGHNMGLTHSRRQDGEGGTFTYATGHGIDHQFATVMADPARFGSARRTPLFSSPALDCSGQPCGVDHQDERHGADAVRVLNLVRFQIADYMPTEVSELPSRLVARIDGRPVNARIALAASIDKGLSYTNSVSPDQHLDISADFYIDPQHVGHPGQFHIVADLTAAGLGFVQLNAQGQVFDWDGTPEGLIAYQPPEPLKPVEYLNILTDFQPLPELIGHPLVLFIAYQLPETGEVVYTQEPLTVQIRAQP